MESVEMVDTAFASRWQKGSRQQLSGTPFLPGTRRRTTDNISAASILECVATSLDDQLHGKLDRIIKQVGGVLPVSGNMLELHCDTQPFHFDFAYRINKDYDAPLLRSACLPPTIQPFLDNNSGDNFRNIGAWFKYGVENICIEHDFPFDSPPAVFFDLNRDKRFDPKKAFGDLNALGEVFQYPVSGLLGNFLAEVSRAGLRAVYYGFMRSRKDTSIRLTIEGVGAGSLVEATKTLGWKGDPGALLTLQQAFLSAGHRLVLCIDFNTEIGDKLGIEVHCRNWEVLLDKLVKTGFCPEEHSTLLKSWPGELALPHSLSAALTAIHQRAVTAIFRRLNHFKFIIEKNTINAKAYLYYCF